MDIVWKGMVQHFLFTICNRLIYSSTVVPCVRDAFNLDSWLGQVLDSRADAQDLRNREME